MGRLTREYAHACELLLRPFGDMRGERERLRRKKEGRRIGCVVVDLCH
jgi:hypothetical protein